MDARAEGIFPGLPDFRTGPERAGISIEPKVPAPIAEMRREQYDTDTALEVFENLLLLAASVPLAEDLNKHPLVLVQAAKGLVGLRPEEPSQRAMDFALDVCEGIDYEPPDRDRLRVNSDELGEIVSVHELERAIQEGDLATAQKQAGRLITVSDNRSLLYDVLLELAAQVPVTAVKVVPFVHSSQRAMDFVGTRNTADFLLPALEAAVQSIAKQQVAPPGQKSLTPWEALPYLENAPMDVITLAAHATQIGEDEHVKGASIQNGLESSLAVLVESLERGDAGEMESRSGSAVDLLDAVERGNIDRVRAIGRHLGAQGTRAWLLEVLEGVGEEQINPELVLWADAFRMLFRNAKKQYYVSLGELAVEHFTNNYLQQ